MPTLPKAKKRPWLSPRPTLKPQEGRKVRSDFYLKMPWRNFRAQQKEIAIDANKNLYVELAIAGADLRDYPKDVPLCAEMLKQGRYVAAKYLDHIKPINPADAYDTCGGKYGEPLSEDNVQWLSVAAHARKSGAEHGFHKKVNK